MRARNHIIRLSLCLALAVAFLAGCDSHPTTTTAAVPRFERGPCTYNLGIGLRDGDNVHCGFLVVREDRTNPSSRLIKLAVAILHTASQTPAPDPVIYLSGGPGESPLTDFAPFFTSISEDSVLGNRDLIIFDPRGVGFSQPSLDCPELRDAEYGTLDQNQTPQQLVALERAALQRCYTRLTNDGIDLSLYNTVTNAADVNDLIQALGYPYVNLEAGSYGTRLALEYMRDFPGGARSVILDSVLAPQETFFTSIPPAVMRSFTTLFGGCAANPTCNANYPHLEAMLYTLMAQLDAHPATLHAQDDYTGKSYTVLLNGSRLASLLTFALYDSSLIPRIPLAISDALHSDSSELQLQRMFSQVWFTEDAISRGMWYSTECSEDAPFITPGDVDAAEQALTPPLRAADLFQMQGRLSVCQFWKVSPLSPIHKQAVTSSIPTFIMEGEYDPVTPPPNGQLVLPTLSNGTLLVFPGIGHGVMYTGPCPLQIALGFFDTANKPPILDCYAQMGEPAFI